MDILQTATEWCKAEIFSSKFFVLFGLMLLAATIGFWQLGKTEMAKAFVYPTLVTGSFLLMVGVGLWYTNANRMAQFKEAYHENAALFIQSEIERAEKTMQEYQRIVFMVFPILIALSALVITFFSQPLWRAIAISTIAMSACILLVDSNANARMEDYYKALKSAQNQ